MCWGSVTWILTASFHDFVSTCSETATGTCYGFSLQTIECRDYSGLQIGFGWTWLFVGNTFNSAQDKKKSSGLRSGELGGHCSGLMNSGHAPSRYSTVSSAVWGRAPSCCHTQCLSPTTDVIHGNTLVHKTAR